MNEQGHTAEFERLLQRNRGRLMAIARSYSDGDVDDLLQEIMLQIWHGMKGFQGRATLDTWCYRVALNTAISWKRSHGRRLKHFPPEPAQMEQLAGTVDGSDSFVLLQEFIRTLVDIDRALILLYLDDMSGQEMAQTLGINVGTVRVRIHRIKQRLADWKVGDT